jgi:hypothetical protein
MGLWWQGIIHDWHKFLPSEFIPYMNHFGDGIKTGRNKTGYYKPTDTGDKKFDDAWFLHQKRGPHHWQYWCLPDEGEGLKVLEIPLKYRKEMIADWLGASRAQGFTEGLISIKKWYVENQHKMQLEKVTRQWIEDKLDFMPLYPKYYRDFSKRTPDEQVEYKH